MALANWFSLWVTRKPKPQCWPLEWSIWRLLGPIQCLGTQPWALWCTYFFFSCSSWSKTPSICDTNTWLNCWLVFLLQGDVQLNVEVMVACLRRESKFPVWMDFLCAKIVLFSVLLLLIHSWVFQPTPLSPLAFCSLPRLSYCCHLLKQKTAENKETTLITFPSCSNEMYTY